MQASGPVAIGFALPSNIRSTMNRERDWTEVQWSNKRKERFPLELEMTARRSLN